MIPHPLPGGPPGHSALPCVVHQQVNSPKAVDGLPTSRCGSSRVDNRPPGIASASHLRSEPIRRTLPLPLHCLRNSRRR